ncbi:hypothetical protein Bbelb_311360 [Branchiostoma belcheri]|nr:hypothetical protein Bbelb_311360 [Branchiostoma belcheri]
MADLSEASMMPASLDVGPREAYFTQADGVGHLRITYSCEEGCGNDFDDYLTVLSDPAAENGQADNIDPDHGEPNCDIEICQDDMEVWETDSEETKPKTAFSNNSGITITLAGTDHIPEKGVHTSAVVVDDTSNISDTRHPSYGLYQNPSCEQDTRNPNLVYTQHDISLNPMYMLYQQDTQDPSPMYVPNTSQDIAQSTANSNQINEPNVRTEPASGLANSNDDSFSIRPCTARHHGTVHVADGRDDNIPTANRLGFPQSNSAIPTSRHSASCRPPNQMHMRIHNALIPNRCTCQMFTHKKQLAVTTAMGTNTYGSDIACCSTGFAAKEIDNLTTDHEWTLSPYTDANPYSTTMPTAPSKTPSHRTTVSFDTTTPESEMSTKGDFAPTSTLYKERHTEMFNAEKITLGGKGSSPGKFKRPNGVAVSSDNEIYVADRGNKRVQVFSVNGVFLRLFKTVVPGTNGQSMFPEGVAIGRVGHLWVAGIIRSTRKLCSTHVVKYSREGLPESTFTLPRGTIAGARTGIAVDKLNDRIIVTANLADIYIFVSNGSLMHVCESPTVEPYWEWTMRGHYVASGNEGNVIISLEMQHFVEVYTRDGHLIFGFRIKFPRGVCTDSLGNIIVAKKDRVDMFTSRGEFIRTVVHTKLPVGVALGRGGELVVTSLYQHIITIFPRQTSSRRKLEYEEYEDSVFLASRSPWC